jgi:hypothetical protein
MNAEQAGFLPMSVWRTEEAARRATEKPEYTEGKALKRASEIQRSRAMLGKSDVLSAALATLNPELAGLVGQKLDPEAKKQLEDSWADELDYLTQFMHEKYKVRYKRPDGNGPATGSPVVPSSAAPAVTHTFIPGQGLVPVR